MSFQVDPESDLWTPAKKAAAEWSYALGRPITVTPDGDIPIFRIPDGVLCNPDQPVPEGMARLGCAIGQGTPDARIEISAVTPADKLLKTLRHEMGHHLHGDGEHLDDPLALMASEATQSIITPMDVKWICERFDCNPPPLSPTLADESPQP